MPVKLIPQGSGFARLTEAVTSEFGQLIELVRQAVRDKLRLTVNGDYYVDMRGIWPDRAVVQVKGRLYSYAYTVNADNTVALAEGEEVVAQFQPVSDKTGVVIPDISEADRAAGRVKLSEIVRESQEAVAFREAQDGTIEVTLIRAGRSGNRNYYPDQALREAAPMFEGVRVFAKSDADHSAGRGKDVRNLIGGIYSVRFVEGKTPDTGSLVGTFKAIDPSDSTVTKMVGSVKRGMQGLLGLSIDADARTRKRTSGSETLREAVKFTKVHSVDLIVEPGAGGGLDRLTEAAADPSTSPPESQEGSQTMPLWKQRMLEAIKAKDPAKHAAIKLDTITDDEVVNLHEAVCGPLVPEPGTQRVTEAASDNTPLTRADLQAFELRGAARERINAAKLPQASKDRLQAQVAVATADRLTEAAVGDLIKAEGDYVARLTESGTVRVPMFGEGSVVVGDRSQTMRDMMDAFWDPSHKDHGRVQSFKECYIEMTGDRLVTGRLRECDQSRMVESLGSSSLGEVLGDSVARRMLAEYRAAVDFDGWRQLVNVVPVSDFRQQHRTRWGGYGDLPAVAEGADYQALSSPTDEEATYGVTKRGGTEDVTLEMIKNDDVGVIRRIPTKLSRAAKRTLAKFVFDFLRSNAAIYDSKALFHADHNNLFTGALDKTSIAAHRLAMLKQTELTSNDRIGITPTRLVVPVELQEAAVDLFKLSTNNEKTFIQSLTMNIIPVWYWTDANDWCTAADPADIPGIEVGFLDGKQEPELFVQDAPNVGSMFSADKLTYKLRHIYGGAVCDYRAFTKAVVA
ncbi:Mu-like prophage major head subunit gpT family protein [Comamonas thiooxydans]|uniref:Mu-like prophage major head subunit gpT family protein n=1 Tax=Comamonas thiooxydans TaxID=363952 RepID=A0AA42PX90_9BURK|nr:MULTISPECIES: hypothetical protein [Comamonas]MDH1333260.1 Mu-like prophage major head subunit gpT family protein [Comamonas thiooxydans]MDH1738967.1 Mu-like prophage major head subunit gpT family protein [Comamonas thiooxydans]MDH1786130.1 Mu-like prophage major head subunit gpT family protein [Comamonas thiooxydans]MPS94984.1 hypothetical protein [Comamonas sp.]